jgi:flavin reductase (DIM6/NTAB) family NADH-FMN oxidoreductase RutF
MGTFIPDLFQRLTTGVYVIGVGQGERANAFTAAWVMQVSYDPLLLALSINARHSSYALLRDTGRFSVNVLAAGDVDRAAHFGQPAAVKKMMADDWTTGRTGVPLLRGAVAWFECALEGEMPAGDHVVVLARVLDGKLVDPNTVPMLYRETGALDASTGLFPATFERRET